MVAATVPFAAPKSEKKSARKSKGESGRQDACPTNAKEPWMPSDRERDIFRYIKFHGEKQTWVADLYGISQSTVSRIVKRYERWIARGGDEQDGAPSPVERQRAQRWLTYERNEWILCSALRIAAEMEREYQTTKSKTTGDSFIHQREVGYEQKTIDRTGVACRFLRLAYRINMDQLRLVEAEPLEALEPFSLEEAGQASVADRAEMRAVQEKAEREAEESERLKTEAQENWRRAQEALAAGRSEGETEGRSDEEKVGQSDEAPASGSWRLATGSSDPTGRQDACPTVTGRRDAYPTAAVHKMHNDATGETGLNGDGASGSAKSRSRKKSCAYAYASGDAADCDGLAPASTPGNSPRGHGG